MNFAILGTREIIFELDNGPVRIIHPDFDVETMPIDEGMFWNVKTHREWFDYLDPKLTLWNSKIDEWYEAYHAG